MEKEGAVLQAYRAGRRKNILILLWMLLCVFLLTVISVGVGSMHIGFTEVLKVFMGRGDPLYRQVIVDLRMPRVLTGILVGAGLGVSGCVLQSLLNNPLASASTLGVSQGASFGAAFAILFLGTGATGGGIESPANPYLTTFCAFLGSMLVTVLVLGFSRIRSIGPSEIVLVGVAASSIFSGCTALMQYFADEVDLSAIVFWTFGDLGRTTYREILLIGAIVLMTSLHFYFNAWNYNAVSSGSNTAM